MLSPRHAMTGARGEDLPPQAPRRTMSSETAAATVAEPLILVLTVRHRTASRSVTRDGGAGRRGRRRSAYEAPNGSVAPGPRVQRRRIEAETVPPLPCTAVSGHASSTAREQGRIRSASLAVVGGVQGRCVALSGGRSRQLAAR